MRLNESKVVAGIVSEELADAVIWPNNAEKHQFLVNFDPLDGSSNLMVNGIVGSIFSILPVPTGGVSNASAFLQPGKAQLAALYVIYGPATMLVISIGNGTHVFTLDQVTNILRSPMRTSRLMRKPTNLLLTPVMSAFGKNLSNAM